MDRNRASMQSQTALQPAGAVLLEPFMSPDTSHRHYHRFTEEFGKPSGRSDITIKTDRTPPMKLWATIMPDTTIKQEDCQEQQYHHHSIPQAQAITPTRPRTLAAAPSVTPSRTLTIGEQFDHSPTSKPNPSPLPYKSPHSNNFFPEFANQIRLFQPDFRLALPSPSQVHHGFKPLPVPELQNKYMPLVTSKGVATFLPASTYRAYPDSPITLEETYFDKLATEYILKMNPNTTGDDLTIAISILLYLTGFASPEQECLALMVGGDMEKAGYADIMEIRLHNMRCCLDGYDSKTDSWLGSINEGDLLTGYMQPKNWTLEEGQGLLRFILDGYGRYQRVLLTLRRLG